MKIPATAMVAMLIIASALAQTAAGSSLTARQAGLNEMVVELSFVASQFEFSKAAGYDHVLSEDMVYLPAAGLPELPWKLAQVAVPYGGHASRVEIAGLEQVTIEGTYRIAPTQPPAALSLPAKPWVAGEDSVYDGQEPYPRQLVRGVSTGRMGDHSVVGFYVSPLSWNPSTGELMLATRMEVRILFDEAPVARSARRMGSPDPLARAIEKAVANPLDVARFAAQVRALATPLPFLGTSMLEPACYEYVLITTAALAPYFEPLVAWKTEKGVPATTVTREWIEATYSGANVQEQIRALIADAYATWGANWVLLGGDTELIPGRPVYAMDCEMGGPGANMIRADLYYSDIDGTWDANAVTPYGEVADSVDMYPDVAVGRAPVANAADVQAFVSKVLRYEQDPPADYALKMMMAGEILWKDPYSDAGISMDMIDSECVPPRFDPILKLYESRGNESAASVLAAMSEGQNLIFHDGHCFTWVMGTGYGSITSSDADTLSNGQRAFIINTVGCWPAAIDQDCIAEHFVKNAEGGAVAFIGNCRYGWGAPGNPAYGYSDVMQREFARVIFVDGIENLGLALAVSKSHFVPFAQDENVFRWNEYQINLLGDPEMPVWTDEPRHLFVDAPVTVRAGGGVVTAVVSDEAGACPDAIVCVMNGDDVYLRAPTDLAGSVTFSISTTCPDSLTLTAVAPNHVPYQRRIGVISGGCVLAWTACDVLDDGDGLANPGETANLSVAVKNSGSQPAEGVWGTLRAADSRSVVTDSIVYYGSLAAGATETGSGTFAVSVDPSLANAEVAAFDLVLRDTLGTHWSSKLPLVVAAPVLDVAGYGMHDLSGDADWIAEPGETIVTILEIENTGLTSASPTVHVTTSDPYLAVVDSVPAPGEIAAGSVGHSIHSVVVSPECPSAHVGLLETITSIPAGASFTDSVYFSVGNLQFSDDCESGAGGWTHGGTGDLWHISSYRSHSGTSSWYVGNEATHAYESNSNAALVSSIFVAGDETRLSFWFWYDFTTYGTDGICVIVEAGGTPDTLDCFGSGGALDIHSRWTRWDRLVEDVIPGSEIGIKLIFKSDGADTAEGIYIDDIALTSKVPGKAGVSGGETGGIVADWGPRVLPNPARTSVSLSFPGEAGQAAVDVYDIRGRHVVRLVKPEGAKLISWDLGNKDGVKVAPGIYEARIECAGSVSQCKIVILR